MKDITFSILIGGRAGEGVKKAAQVLANILGACGLHVCQTDDYQSLIRGGHNFSIVTASTQEVFCAHKSIDLLICFDQRSVDEHLPKLKDDALLFYNSDEANSPVGYPVPMNTVMKKHYSGAANVSLASLAIFAAITGMSLEEMHSEIRNQYHRDWEENISFATELYGLIEKRKQWSLDYNSKAPFRFISGNQAIIQGAWKAGMDIYYGYPMTPASSLLHYAALKGESHGVITIHAESELAAMNMALGSALAGCRAAVGSSGGGFALMQEAYSAAGMVEAPVFCILSSRPGPATGVSTYSAQEDLFMALNQGHGDFDTVVASPDSIQRTLTLSAELMSLAWEYQIPTILLTEKHISEGMTDVHPLQDAHAVADPVMGIASADYERYEIRPDGVSPILFPGSKVSPDTVINWSTHEHTPDGLRTDKSADIIAMKDKRARKASGILAACRKYQMFAEYGEGDLIIFAYGGTVLELREAQKYCQRAFKIVAPIYLEPFPHEELAKYKGARVVVAEHSQSAQFARFLKQKLALTVIHTIKRYDGREFDPLELAKMIEEVENA